jgi:hypothetical protein
MADFDDRSGRDSRLLALVIVIAVVVLVVLARFRFPQNDARPAAVTPGPLERLAARATYDDLAAAVHTVLQRVEGALVMVPVEGGPEARQRIGVRLDAEWAVVHVPKGLRVVKRSPDDPLNVREIDPVRDIAIFSTPLQSDDQKLPSGTAELTGFAYVCVVEPTPDGPTATPMFIGRVRTLLDERWKDSVLVPGGSTELPAGGLVFQIDGRFLGLVIAQPAGGTAIVPSSLLSTVVTLARTRAGGGGP